MKTRLLLSFALTLVMILVMRWQGSALVTPQSPKGIIDLEFAKTPERLQQLQLFMDREKVAQNIYLDFLFIAAYCWFLVAACRYIQLKTNWNKWSNMFLSLAIAAAMFDVFENFLMLLIFNGRFQPSLMEVVFYTALVKFVFAGAVVLYLLLAWPFSLMRKPK
jgi:membrane-associated HD superfamily phosphohydrolase